MVSKQIFYELGASCILRLKKPPNSLLLSQKWNTSDLITSLQCSQSFYNNIYDILLSPDLTDKHVTTVSKSVDSKWIKYEMEIQ